MFRESDETSPRYHETYSNKPNISLQQTLQSPAVDEMYTRNKYATINDKQPKPVPTTFDHYYDPQNPKADWLVYAISVL